MKLIAALLGFCLTVWLAAYAVHVMPAWTMFPVKASAIATAIVFLFALTEELMKRDY